MQCLQLQNLVMPIRSRNVRKTIKNFKVEVKSVPLNCNTTGTLTQYKSSVYAWASQVSFSEF